MFLSTLWDEDFELYLILCARCILELETCRHERDSLFLKGKQFLIYYNQQYNSFFLSAIVLTKGQEEEIIDLLTWENSWNLSTQTVLAW